LDKPKRQKVAEASEAVETTGLLLRNKSENGFNNECVAVRCSAKQCEAM
jgi:hypothetical protein